MLNLYCMSCHPSLNWYSTSTAQTVSSVLGICYCVPLFQHAPKSFSCHSLPCRHQTTNKNESKQACTQQKPTAGLARSSNLHRAGSIKDLISKFSGPDHIFFSISPCNHCSRTGRAPKSAPGEVRLSSASKSSPCSLSSVGQDESPVFSIAVTPQFRDTSQSEPKAAQRDTRISQTTARINFPVGGDAEKTDSKPRNKTQTTDSGCDSVADSDMGSVSKKEKLLTVILMSLHETKHCILSVWRRPQHGTADFLNDQKHHSQTSWQLKNMARYHKTCSSIILMKMGWNSLTDHSILFNLFPENDTVGWRQEGAFLAESSGLKKERKYLLIW